MKGGIFALAIGAISEGGVEKIVERAKTRRRLLVSREFNEGARPQLLVKKIPEILGLRLRHEKAG